LATKRVKVIAVIGLSYCGSTLLNIIFGSHPRIYGGGELHWLLTGKEPNANYKAICRICGENCPYWTPEALEAVREDGFYAYIARLFDKEIIVDTSKMPAFFENISGRPSNQKLQFVYVILVKHPVRHIASFIVNLKKEQRKRLRSRRDIKLQIDTIYEYYENLFLNLGQTFSQGPFCIMQYEKMVFDPALALTPLLDILNLEYNPLMNDCYEQSHHVIGGNSAALYQFKNKWQGETLDMISTMRQRYYAKKRGIFLDNKYLEALTPDEVKWIQKRKKVHKLFEMLGYDAL
jgi:hypothetical protein